MRDNPTDTAPAAPHFSRPDGFTLPELLVAMLLTAVFAIAAQRLCLSLLRSVALLEATSQQQEALRVALAVITRDLRDAGYGLSADGSGVRLASEATIRIARDLNGDGDTEDAHERVGYGFDPDGLRLARQLGSAAPQPMLDDLAPDGFRIVYYDASGNLLPASTPLSAEDMARIHRVDLQLTLESSRAGDFAAAPLRLTRTMTVALRNE